MPNYVIRMKAICTFDIVEEANTPDDARKQVEQDMASGGEAYERFEINPPYDDNFDSLEIISIKPQKEHP